MLPVLATIRRRSLSGSSLLLPLLVGCSAIRFGATPPPDLQGTWTGAFEIQGQRLEGSLAVEQEGTRLDAVFSAPVPGLVAEGEGEVAPEGSVWLDFAYDLECPGTARLEGQVDEDRSLLSGSVEARDCTGAARGTFAFRR